MPRVRISLALLPFAVALALPAQTAPATNTPSDQPVLTVRRNTRLVVLDVVVTDKKQNPIRGLKPADFTILEKKQPQTIQHFEVHEPPAQPAVLAMPKLPPNVFTNYTPLPEGMPLNILLLDALNTPMKDQSYVRYQMLEFLKSMPQGTRIAVFGLTTHLRILQGFTTDPEVLRAALSGKKGLPNASVLLNDPVSGDFPGSDMSMSDFAETSANVAQFQAETQSFQMQLRQRYTLDAMNDLARYLASMPGRKNLIWFSGSFPLDILPDGNLEDPFSVVADAEDEFRQTTDLLTAGQVAVYPVDARGLMAPPMFSASQSGRGFARNPGAMTNAIGAWGQQTAEEHMTMDAMADATGGKAFYNTNGLKDAVQKSLSLGSHYYTITYTPTNTKWNGEYRNIDVQVDQPGVQVYFRHGYYADVPEQPVKKKIGPAPAASNAMLIAMLRGAPSPTQILFETYIARVSSTPDAVLSVNNVIGPKVHGPYNSYAINSGVDAHNIQFTTAPDGRHRASIEFTALLYDADGTMLNSISNTLETNLDAATYAKVMQHGLQMSQILSVPVGPHGDDRKKQEYFFRVGVHDLSTDKVGAVEVPLSAVKDTTAAATPAKQ